MRHRNTLTLLVVVVALVMAFGVTSAFGATGFTDVPASHPFSADITRLADLEIIGGFPDGTFRPDNLVTRQQFAKIIVLATGKHTEAVDNETNPTFSDVSPALGLPYPFDYIEEAAAAGFIRGDQGRFNPAQNITRVQLALIVVRAGGPALADPPAGYQTGFTDVPAYAQAEVARAKFNGILDGKTPTSFDPYANATRGQVAKMVSRLLDKIGEPGKTVVQGKVTNTADVGVPAHIEIVNPATHELIAETDTAADGTYKVEVGTHSGGTYVKAIPTAADQYFENQEYKFVLAKKTNTRDLKVSAKNPAGATYVGMTTCRACHPTKANSFLSTFHARSIQEDLSEFNPAGWPAVGEEKELDFLVAKYGESTATVKPVLLHPAENHYAVRIGDRTFDVDGTYGGLDVPGGNPEWKQRYLTKVPADASNLDATSNQDYLIIPIQWNQNSEFNRSKWIAYSPSNWWNAATRSFATQCAACHNTAPDITFRMDLTSQEICGQCHSRGDSIDPEGHEYPWNAAEGGAYKIGADLSDYSSWTFEVNKGSGFYWEAAPGDPAYPSGYIAANKHHEQINDLVQGKMPMVKCAECHDVHGTDYRRNLRGDPNGSTAATNSCTAAGACHVHDAIFDPNSTHNKARMLTMGQVNYDCSWCHMAETSASAQFFNVDDAGTYKQGDIANHTFWPIRPDTVDKDGKRVPDSCNMIGCHASGTLFPVTGAMFDGKAAIIEGE
ncbi:MAG: S-layer homology domain-containing protein [Actinobacteria bacterium]|nr:S-layer homology domain-containing protein [Actinomycetota bacterium]